MTQICQNPNGLKRQSKNDNGMIKIEEYKADEIGAPFDVILCNSVEQRICPDSGAELGIRIPYMSDLLKEISLARAIHPRKFSAGEIKFLRKAIGLKAIALAKILDISPEHLSRCENGDRVLSGAAEKLFRVVILRKRFNGIEATEKILQELGRKQIDQIKVDRLREIISDYKQYIKNLEEAVFDSPLHPVHDSSDRLKFLFGLRQDTSEKIDADPDEDEHWKRKAA